MRASQPFRTSKRIPESNRISLKPEADLARTMAVGPNLDFNQTNKGISMNLRKSLRGACALLTLLLSIGLFAYSQVNAQPNGLPPLIDRESFFGDPEIVGAQISPDGKFIAFIKPFKGTRNIWVKRTEEPFDKAKPVTADTTRPIPGYFWSRDGKYILFVQDKAGDENYLVYAVNPNDAPTAGQDVP